MDEIVVDEITEKVTVKNVGKNISKDCFCFPNIGSQKNIWLYEKTLFLTNYFDNLCHIEWGKYPPDK